MRRAEGAIWTSFPTNSARAEREFARDGERYLFASGSREVVVNLKRLFFREHAREPSGIASAIISRHHC
jgi:hypothetical protein